jgi:hypothetical protein
MKAITLSILLATLTVNSLSSQIKRIFYYSDEFKRNISMRYNEYGLFFDSPLLSEEKIHVGVKSDSLDNRAISFSIYIYFPKNINPKGFDIVIGYKDGTSDIFQQYEFNAEDNYAEYYVARSIKDISSKKVKSITIRGVKKFNVDDETYFIDFFKHL